MIITTLMYLVRGEEVLLAMKKRGFGSGMWNAPGGKADPGETAEAAAIRETQEEVGVTPTVIQFLGDIKFYMPSLPDFPGHHIHVYTATAWDGEPIESEEMRPQWFMRDALPYDTMWPADRRWLPEVLNGTYTCFTGTITQNGDTLITYDLHEA
jgi:mutator protein MutT